MCDLEESIIEFDPSKSDVSIGEEVEFVCFDGDETEYVFESELAEDDLTNYEYLIEGEWKLNEGYSKNWVAAILKNGC